jgi:hypothetical protein
MVGEQAKRGAGTAMAVSLVVALSSAAMADEELVRQKALDCLVRNASAYLAVEKNPQLVFLSLCPNVSPTAEEKAAAHTVNSLPVIPIDEEGAAVSEVLVLSHAEIKCLADRTGEIVQRVPGSESTAEPLVRIDLSKCNQQ